jgi:DNA-binding HxlR family transcriptional regulator
MRRRPVPCPSARGGAKIDRVVLPFDGAGPGDARRITQDPALPALQGALGVLGAKWSVSVLIRLDSGTLRYTELLRAIDGVSRRMLAATLRQLERDGLVLRHVYARVPARVEYELSQSGEELLAALIPLADWGGRHRERILEAREQYDRLEEWRTRGEELRARTHARNPRVPGVY